MWMSTSTGISRGLPPGRWPQTVLKWLHKDSQLAWEFFSVQQQEVKSIVRDKDTGDAHLFSAAMGGWRIVECLLTIKGKTDIYSDRKVTKALKLSRWLRRRQRSIMCQLIGTKMQLSRVRWIPKQTLGDSHDGRFRFVTLSECCWCWSRDGKLPMLSTTLIKLRINIFVALTGDWVLPVLQS